MQTRFAQFILHYPGRLAMPIGVSAGLELAGISVRSALSDAAAQTRAVLALHHRFNTPVLLSAMDLSAEAETFGCAIRMPEDDVPTVIGRRTVTLEQIAALPSPRPGAARTAVHLETCRRLAANPDGAPVLGGMIGPFSLAGRIFGVSEALEATAADPEPVLLLLEKITPFLIQYAAAFRAAGAAGVIMAEPAAGLLSPRSLAHYSAPYVRRIVEAVQSEDFAVVLHNCGARLAHLSKMLESGAGIYHFGAPMDLVAALAQVDEHTILCGNLDPAGLFFSGTPAVMRSRVGELLAGVGPRKNFVLSSGCDLPPGTPLANLEAFYAATAELRIGELQVA